MHDTKSICLRALARLPVVIPIWFLAIIFPFFGPINSAVGALLVSFTVYIIPALAHMLTYKDASARKVSSHLPWRFLFKLHYQRSIHCILLSVYLSWLVRSSYFPVLFFLSKRYIHTRYGHRTSKWARAHQVYE